MKKLISVLLVTLMLLSTATVVMAEGTEDVVEYELYTGTTASNYELLKTSFPSVDGISQFTFTGQKIYLPKNAAVGDIGYTCLILRKTNESNSAQYDPVTFAEILNDDNIYDYELQIEFQRVTNTNYVTDVEIGLGNYQADSKAADTCKTKPSVAKTIDFGNAFGSVANGSTATLSVDVAEVLSDGTEQKFPYNGTEPNTLTGANANLIAIKSKCSKAVTTRTNFIQVNSIKLVKKQETEEEVPTDTSIKSIDLITHQVNSKNMLLLGYPPKADSNSYNFNPSSYKIGLANNSVLNGVYRGVLGCQPGVTFESILNGGSLEDYVIEFTTTKAAGGSYVTDFEFGLGVANMDGQAAFTQGSTYAKFSTITKTIPFEAFDAAYEAQTTSGGEIMTLTIPVKDILNNGVEERLLGSEITSFPEFDASTINEFVVKATCSKESGSNWPGVMTFTSVKLVKKTTDITLNEDTDAVDFAVSDYSDAPAGINGHALVAYYKNVDGNDKLIGCDILPLNASSDNEAAVSIPKDSAKASEATKIKAIFFNSINNISPLTDAVIIFEAE